MLRFLINTFLTGLAVAFFLKWGREQAESQVDKMQAAVHGTPGAEPPVPPEVLVAGVGLLGGHWLVARTLGLNFAAAMLSLLAAIGAGFGYYIYGASERPQ
jgi:hypothetical protein